MLRTVVMALVGAVMGTLWGALLLWLTSRVLAWHTAPQVFLIEPSTIYLCLTLAGGFGSLTGALVGVAGVLGKRPASTP